LKRVVGEGKLMVSAIAIFAHLFVNEVIYLETIFENTIETTPTEQEEDEHHSEEMSTSQSPDAHASFDRRNEFTHNHACMTNCISYDVDNPDTHFDKNSNTNSHRWRCAKCTKDFVSIKTLSQNHTCTILSCFARSQ
jgi:ABC-type Zn2+ transport system substrate-binding protein/surface adhesin